MLEKYIESKLRSEIKKLGGMAIKLPATYLTGIPDRIVILPQGRIYFIELKAPGKIPRPIQKVVMEKLSDLGCDVGVIDRLESLDEFLEKVKGKKV